MNVLFHKYQGTGNDFILLDNRKGEYSFLTEQQIAKLCNRHFGIGADGVMLLENCDSADFYMNYINADGKPSSMCGNGGRCITAFAKQLGIIENSTSFLAVDGMHYASIDGKDVELQMQDVQGLQPFGTDWLVETGSPHYVTYVAKALDVNVVQQGKEIRYSDAFVSKGVNVNFIEVRSDKSLFVVTYERGVEAETLSCGTGVTACALVQIKDNIGSNFVRVLTKGGLLMIKCVNQGQQLFTDIYLCGEAKYVFTGEISV
jgi:diaminopimelate epimerase